MMTYSSDCQNRIGGFCVIATRMAGVSVEANEATCKACGLQSEPQSENNVTKGLAAAKLLVLKKPLPTDLSNLEGKKACMQRCIWVWIEELGAWVEDGFNCTFIRPSCHCTEPPDYEGEFDGQMVISGNCENR